MAIAEYPDEQVSAQPIGYWSRVAYQATVGRLRAELAVQQLTQPHWWTLNHVPVIRGNGPGRSWP